MTPAGESRSWLVVLSPHCRAAWTETRPEEGGRARRVAVARAAALGESALVLFLSGGGSRRPLPLCRTRTHAQLRRRWLSGRFFPIIFTAEVFPFTGQWSANQNVVDLGYLGGSFNSPFRVCDLPWGHRSSVIHGEGCPALAWTCPDWKTRGHEGTPRTVGTQERVRVCQAGVTLTESLLWDTLKWPQCRDRPAQQASGPSPRVPAALIPRAALSTSTLSEGLVTRPGAQNQPGARPQ